MTEGFTVLGPTRPTVPLVVSVPHTGTEVPDAIARRFASPTVAALPDTDWHLHRLYAFAPELGLRMVCARWNRYVVDLNRPADQRPMYPGRNETELVPLSTFAEEPIYRQGQEPDAAEVAERVARYWRPYHARLQGELEEIRARFGYALLFDAHSIQSEVPRLFAGTLPELMLGDVGGKSAAPAISDAVFAVHERSGYSCRRNDPFKGGYITRAFGDPAHGVHALQLEMGQRIYMEEGPPFRYREDLAAKLEPVLRATLLAFVAAAARVQG